MQLEADTIMRMPTKSVDRTPVDGKISIVVNEATSITEYEVSLQQICCKAGICVVGYN